MKSKNYKIAFVVFAIFAYSFGYCTSYEDRYSNSFKKALKVYDKNREEGVPLLKVLAKQGDSYAQAYLGKLYNYGYGVKKDKAKAEEWYRKSAAKNNAMGMHGVGLVIYYRNHKNLFGPTNKKDRFEAMEWYKKAAALKYAPAAQSLATLYYKLNKKYYNSEKSIYWANKNAEWGTAYDKYYIGMKFRDEMWFPKDMKRSNYWLKKSHDEYLIKSDKGDWSSQEMIGHMNYYGLGTQKNTQKAIKYLNLALKNPSTLYHTSITESLLKIENETSYNSDRVKKVDSVFGIAIGGKISSATNKPTPVSDSKGVSLSMSIDIPKQASRLGFKGATLGTTPTTGLISSVTVYKIGSANNREIFDNVRKLLEEKYGVFTYRFIKKDLSSIEKMINDITISLSFSNKGITLIYSSAQYEALRDKESYSILKKTSMPATEIKEAFAKRDIKDFKALRQFNSIEAFDRYIDKYTQECLDSGYGGTGSLHCLVSYALWDKELNINYKKLHNKLDTKGRKLLKKSQKQWLLARDLDRKATSYCVQNDGKGGTAQMLIASASHNNTMSSIVRARVILIQNWLQLLRTDTKVYE